MIAVQDGPVLRSEASGKCCRIRLSRCTLGKQNVIDFAIRESIDYQPKTFVGTD